LSNKEFPKILQIENWSDLPKINEIPPVDIISLMTKKKFLENNQADDSPKKISVLYLSLELLQKYLKIYVDDPETELAVGICPLLVRTKCLMNDLKDIEFLPKKILSLTSEIQHMSSSTEIQLGKGARTYLHLHTKPPQALKEFTPDFVTNEYMPSHKKAKDKDKVQTELKKLKRKVKSEQKGAERELKLDAKFIARKKVEKRQEREREKKEKQKQIRVWLDQQQHESKLLQKEKRKSAF